MEQIAAEEITSFDTSMDLLCRRRDLVLVIPGALICLRSLYQRAALRGVLSQLRYVILREEDYVVGTMEEKLRDVVRAAGNLPGVRVIVIYLSCLDILVRLDFADIEARLSAETGCVVRCFFRGPLAKADAMPHETAEDILRSLPPEETCIEADISLPPPMSDIAGAADFLRAADTANVLVTPSGCRSPIARMDMTRERRDVYAALPAAEDYIFGMEETHAGGRTCGGRRIPKAEPSRLTRACIHGDAGGIYLRKFVVLRLQGEVFPDERLSGCRHGDCGGVSVLGMGGCGRLGDDIILCVCARLERDACRCVRTVCSGGRFFCKARI